MDPTLREFIIEELTILLKRDPNETEIMNAQTDQYVMNRVMMKQLGFMV